MVLFILLFLKLYKVLNSFTLCLRFSRVRRLFLLRSSERITSQQCVEVKQFFFIDTPRAFTSCYFTLYEDGYTDEKRILIIFIQNLKKKSKTV